MTGASISRLADASRTNLGRVEPLGALGLDSASFELSGASVFLMISRIFGASIS